MTGPVHNGGWLKRFSSQEMHFHLAAEVTANELLVFVHLLLQLPPPPPPSLTCPILTCFPIRIALKCAQFVQFALSPSLSPFLHLLRRLPQATPLRLRLHIRIPLRVLVLPSVHPDVRRIACANLFLIKFSQNLELVASLPSSPTFFPAPQHLPRSLPLPLVALHHHLLKANDICMRAEHERSDKRAVY